MAQQKKSSSKENGQVQGKVPKDLRSANPSQTTEDAVPRSGDRDRVGQYTGEGTPSVQKK
jgi:hypothetical protein